MDFCLIKINKSMIKFSFFFLIYELQTDHLVIMLHGSLVQL